MKGARRTRLSALRDQSPSGFALVLERLIRLAPEIRGAAVVDGQGETVDYGGVLPPFEVKVAAAEWRILLDVAHTPSLTAGTMPRQIAVRAARGSFLIRSLEDGYALVLVLPRYGFGVSARALSRVERDLYREAGWDHPSDLPVWHPVEVETAPTDRGRPVRIRSGPTWQGLEVMGTMVGLGRRERGYRVRLRSGAELTLIREPMGRWYSDEPPEAEQAQPAPELPVEPRPEAGGRGEPKKFSTGAL